MESSKGLDIKKEKKVIRYPLVLEFACSWNLKFEIRPTQNTMLITIMEIFLCEPRPDSDTGITVLKFSSIRLK